MLSKEKREELENWGINELIIAGAKLGEDCGCNRDKTIGDQYCECSEGQPIYKDGIFQFFITEYEICKYLKSKITTINNKIRKGEIRCKTSVKYTR